MNSEKGNIAKEQTSEQQEAKNHWFINVVLPLLLAGGEVQAQNPTPGSTGKPGYEVQVTIDSSKFLDLLAKIKSDQGLYAALNLHTEEQTKVDFWAATLGLSRQVNKKFGLYGEAGVQGSLNNGGELSHVVGKGGVKISGHDMVYSSSLRVAFPVNDHYLQAWLLVNEARWTAGSNNSLGGGWGIQAEHRKVGELWNMNNYGITINCKFRTANGKGFFYIDPRNNIVGARFTVTRSR